MEKTMPYKDLDHALRFFRLQVSEGIPWALDEPVMNSPQEIWNYLKPKTNYKKDPKGRELFQRIDTLLTEKNWHFVRGLGEVGAGDCDCFTIAALSMLLANKFTDCGIVLAGRSKLYPVHIWAYVNDNGTRKDFDLTCKKYGETRHYPFKQYIPYKLNSEEKKMILELAEGGGPQRHRAHPYVWLPMSEIQVREDFFDNMPPGAFQYKMLSEGVPLSEIEELSAKRAERRAAKPTHAQKKAEKQIVKNEAKATKPKNVRKAQRLDTRATKAQGNLIRKEYAGQAKVAKGENPNRESFGTQFQKVAGAAAQFIPQQQPEYPQFEPPPEQLVPDYYEAEEVIEVPDEMILPEPEEMEEGYDPYLFHKILFGSLAAGAVAGIAVAATRK